MSTISGVVPSGPVRGFGTGCPLVDAAGGAAVSKPVSTGNGSAVAGSVADAMSAVSVGASGSAGNGADS